MIIMAEATGSLLHDFFSELSTLAQTRSKNLKDHKVTNWRGAWGMVGAVLGPKESVLRPGRPPGRDEWEKKHFHLELIPLRMFFLGSLAIYATRAPLRTLRLQVLCVFFKYVAQVPVTTAQVPPQG